MSEIIVKMNDRHIKLKGGEYVRDIVRCKDCKYWSEQDKKSPFYRGTDCIRYGGMGMATADDFCSYGEVSNE